jgi:hypothetical protein
MIYFWEIEPLTGETLGFNSPSRVSFRLGDIDFRDDFDVFSPAAVESASTNVSSVFNLS